MSEVNYTTRGQGNLNTVLGAIGTAGGIPEIVGGLFGGMRGGGWGGHGGYGGYGGYGMHEHLINRYEAGMQEQLAHKDMEIAYLRGREESKKDDLEAFKYYDARFNKIEDQLCAQAVVNGQISANLACMQDKIGTLMGLTKTIVPIGNICPAPMLQYNSWVAPTATAATPEAGA